MKPKEDIIEHIELLTKAGKVVRKTGIKKGIRMDFEKMATRKSGGRYKKSEMFNANFMEGFYNTLLWVRNMEPDEATLRSSYKDIQEVILVKKQIPSEFSRLIGERNACAFALNWDINPNGR